MAENNSPDVLSQTIKTALGEKLQAASKRQLQLMDGLLEMRLEESNEPVTEAEIKGMYQTVTEEVLPISL